MTNPVQAATNFITNKLDSTGWLNTVTHGEVKAATSQLQSLPAAQADAVVDNLARSGKLNTLASEVLDGNIVPGQGGLSTSDRQTFFADMAKKLDGQSLASLHNSFTNAAGNGSTAGLERGQELASAIAQHASPQAKLDFIRAMAPATTNQQYVSGGSNPSTIINADPQAAAVGTVLGSLRGARAQLGFGQLNDQQRTAVIQSSIQQTTTTTSMSAGFSVATASNITWNTTGYSNLMTAAASMPVNANNADMRARIFDSAADVLRPVRDANTLTSRAIAPTIGGGAALSNITDGMTRLINSDTTGTITELSRNEATADGGDFAVYAQQMLNQNKENQLGPMMGRLQAGNGRNENPMVRLNQTRAADDGNVSRQNAATLGYFVGAVSVGAGLQTENIQSQRDSAALILKFAAIVGDKATGPVVGGAITAAGEFINPTMRALIQDNTADAGKVLSMGALPRNNQGEPAMGDPVLNAFTRGRSDVLDHARP